MAEHRVLFLVTEDWYFATHRLPLAQAAKRAGFDVTVVTRCGGQCSRIEAEGIRVIPFSMDRRGLNPLGLLSEAIRLARIYRRLAPDLLHHVALRPVVVGGLAARIAGVPHIVAARTGMGFLFTESRRKRSLRAALQRLLAWLLKPAQVIVQNPVDRDFVLEQGVPPDGIHLIQGSGVDTTQFAFQSEPEGTPVVMVPARLLWDKGVGEFVSAARLLATRARFVLVGAPDTGNPASVQEEEILQWQREGVVEWWGRREDMATTLAQAHIVCLPSYREGLPKALIEAMSVGRACITTDAPGCRDCVRDGDNGLLVPVKDATALATAIARLLGDAELRKRMGQRGRERAEQEFSVAKVNNETLEVYGKLIGNGSRQ